MSSTDQKGSVQIKPVGDSALQVLFSEQIDIRENRRVLALDKELSSLNLPEITEMVPTYGSLLVHYDPVQRSYEQMAAQIFRLAEKTEPLPSEETRIVEIPVHYGGEYGPDLPFVARHNNLTEEEVIEIHCSRDYPVFMMGFTPGFPYLGGMDERIATPRLDTPRTKVKAGSVGIAGEQTGVYPVDSPGGWEIIGWTEKVLFDPLAEDQFLIKPGDSIRFVPVK